MDSPPRKAPTLLQALIPVLVLILLLAASVYLFGDGSSQGPNQIALMLSAGVGIVIGVRLDYPWRELERGIVRGISLSMGAILILLVVGALIGTWILAGIVPTMIDYGLRLLSPAVFYAASCVICAFVSIATGSSWTTASTIGIALVGVATAQNLNLGASALGLETLDLEQTAVTDAGVKQLKKLSNLKNLKVQDLGRARQQGLIQGPGTVEGLKQLDDSSGASTAQSLGVSNSCTAASTRAFSSAVRPVSCSKTSRFCRRQFSS